MNRSAPGSAGFAGGRQAAAFVSGLVTAASSYPIELHAYCALPRHYHLLARAEAAALQEALAFLETVSGFPADRTARVVPVGFGRHLMSVSRYIHLNPVDAGLVWCPEHWRLSSFREYLGDPAAPRSVVTEPLLGCFGAIGARHRHRAYVYAGLDPGTRDLAGRPRWGPLVGYDSFASDLAWRIEPVFPLSPVPAPRADPGTLPELSEAAAALFGVPEPALRSPRRGGPEAAAARGALVFAARIGGAHPLRDVAAFMGYASPAAAAAAAERFERASRVDTGLRHRAHRLVEAATTFLTSAAPHASLRALSASPCPPRDR